MMDSVQEAGFVSTDGMPSIRWFTSGTNVTVLQLQTSGPMAMLWASPEKDVDTSSWPGPWATAELFKLDCQLESIVIS